MSVGSWSECQHSFEPDIDGDEYCIYCSQFRSLLDSHATALDLLRQSADRCERQGCTEIATWLDPTAYPEDFHYACDQHTDLLDRREPYDLGRRIKTLLGEP
jgi:hypothetical protein